MLKRLKLPNWILKYLVAATILAVPLYPKFPFIKITGTFVSIRLEDVLLAVLAIVTFLEILPQLKTLLKDKVIIAIGIFLTIGLLSLICSIFVTQTVQPHIAFLHWARRVEYFVPFVAGFLLVKKDKHNLEFMIKILMLVVITSFVYGFGQRHFSWPIIITQNQEYSAGVALRWVSGSHINATFAGHYDLATFLVLILPVLVGSFFILKKKGTKIALLVTVLAGLWLLVNSASRISIASYLMAISITLFLLRKYWAIPLVIVVSLLFISFSSNLLDRYMRLFTVTIDRVKETQLLNNIEPSAVLAAGEPLIKRREVSVTPTPAPVFEDRSTSIRFNVEWPRAMRAFAKNPLLGTGYSSITLATDSDYLRLLGEVGLLGFLSFGLIFMQLIKSIFLRLPLDKHFKGLELAFVAGMMGAIPGIFVNAIFIDIFEASKFAILFWMLTGVLYAKVTHTKISND